MASEIPISSSRKSIASTRRMSVRSEKDPIMVLFWEGKFLEAESKIMTKRLTDATAAVRYGLIQFARVILTGDKSLPLDCADRLSEAEVRCNDACVPIEELLLPGMEKHAQNKHGIVRRLSRRASTTVPLMAKLGLTTKYNPGELDPSDLEFEIERQRLKEWRHLQGYAALCSLLRGVCSFLSHGYMKGGLNVRRAYTIVKQASLNPDFENMEPTLLHLVIGAIQLLFSNVPPSYVSFLKAIGFISDQTRGMEILEKCLKADPYSETHCIARLMLATHFLMTSQQEYRTDRLENLKKAETLLMDVLSGKVFTNTITTTTSSPFVKDWILFRWLRSHVMRRLGNLEISLKEIKVLASIMERECAGLQVSAPDTTTTTTTTAAAAALQQQSSPGTSTATTTLNPSHYVGNYRLAFDQGMLQFVRGEYKSSSSALQPLVDKTSFFSAKILGCAILSSCAAMLGDENVAVQWLDYMDDVEVKGQMEKSIHLWKLDTLFKRPHKRLLAYEILYLYGYMKCFDTRVSGTTPNAEHMRWLQKSLKNVLEIHEASTVSVVYPEFPATPISASEELLVSALLCGSLYSLLGDAVNAEKYLNLILHNKDNKYTAHLDDPYMAPFALYELASLCIRKREYIQARAHLARAIKKCRKRNFSFHHMLMYKCVGAARYINELTGVKAENPIDTLSATYLGPGTGFASAAGGGDEDDDDDDDEDKQKQSSATSSASSTIPKKRGSLFGSIARASGGSRSASPVRQKKQQDLVVGNTKLAEGMTIGHQDGLSELKMKAVGIAAGARVSVPRQMKPFETTSWQLTVEDQDIEVSVEFFSNSKTQDSKDAIIVTEKERHEAGEFVEGFYLSQTAGTLILTFDNTYSLFTPKTVHYYVE